MLLLAVLMLSCGVDGKGPTEPGEGPVLEDSLPYKDLDTSLPRPDSSFRDPDTLDVHLPGLDLRGRKEPGEQVVLTYRVQGGPEKELTFRFPDYSAVVFPDRAITVLDDSAYHYKKLLFLGDSLLILPLIGIHNYITAVVINLRTGAVLASDNRSFFSTIWVRTRPRLRLLSSDMPYPDPDASRESYRYHLTEWTVEANEIRQTAEYRFSDTHWLHEGESLTYPIARRYLR